MKNKILSLILSSTMIFSNIGFVFADVDLDNPPIEPTKPKAESYEDNNKIEEYNNKVKEYNNKVDEYNAAVNKEYENKEKEIEKENIKIEEHNQNEIDRVANENAENEKIKTDNENKKQEAELNKVKNNEIKADAEKKNAEAKTKAEEEAAIINAKIDEDYQAAVEKENQRVKEINDKLDEIESQRILDAKEHNAKVNEIEAANAAEQARVDNINRELKEKYEKEKTIYEERINQPEEVAEEEYYGGDNENIKVVRGKTNKDDIITYENINGQESCTYNYSGNNKRYVNFSLITTIGYTTTGTDWDNDASKYSNKVYGTIADLNNITEAPLNINDEGEGRNLINYKTNEIGLEACDNIIRKININPISNYYNSSNGIQEAGKAEAQISFKDFPSDAQVFKNLQENGSVFVDPETGKKYTGKEINSENFDICWFSVKYQANGWRVSGVLLKDGVIVMPEEPTYETAQLQEVPERWNEEYIQPTYEKANPIEKPNYVIPTYEVYTPELLDETYEETPLKNVIPADIWELLPPPMKRAELQVINYMNLFNNSEIKVPLEGNSQSKNETDEALNFPVTNRTTNNSNFIEYTYADGEESVLTDTKIIDNEVPLAAPNQKKQGAWALINLISMLLTFLIAFLLIITLFINKVKENDEKKYKNKIIRRIFSIIISIVSVIIFILTENMNLPMILIDKWTIVMIIILIINIIIAICSRRKEKKNLINQKKYDIIK